MTTEPSNDSKKTPQKPRKLMPVGFAPINDFDLEKWFLNARLSPAAEEFVRKAVEAPSRHLSGAVSHTIHYPCAKFGHAIKFESRNYAYPFGLQCIYRHDVLYVVEEPGQLKINLPKGGCLIYTPDLLVLTEHGIEIYEVKPADTLANHGLKKKRVFHEETGRYHGPVIESFFAKWGFKFQVISQHEIHPNFVQAANDLHPYITGYPKDPITNSERETFLVWVEQNAGRRLGEMAVLSHPRRFEIAQYLIAQGKVFTSLSEINLEEPNGIRLYPTPQDEAAFHLYLDEARPRPANLDELGYRLRAGSLIEIGWKDYQVVGLTNKLIKLRAVDDQEVLEPLTHRQLLDLKPRIGRFLAADKLFETYYHNSDLEYRLTYAARKHSIKPYLKGGDLERETPDDRTIRFNRDRYRKAEKDGRSGDAEIFPKFGDCGNTPLVLSPKVQEAFTDLINKHILNPEECTAVWVWRQLSEKFSQEEIDLGERTILRRIAAIDIYRRRCAARGKAGAADHEPYYGESPTMGSPHGRKAFQRAHIDSTPANVKHPEDERQYVSRMIDGYTGKEIGRYTYAGHPSAMMIREVLLDCVARYGALPAEITCDKGSEHKNAWLQKSLAKFQIILDYRPTKQPRNGGPVEGSFAADCGELWDNLPGNLKHSHYGRILSKALEAQNEAILSAVELKELHDAYCNLRNERPGADKVSPNALETASFEKNGPPPRQCPNRDEMELLLLPFVKGTTRKVSQRGIVRCNGKNYGIVGMHSPLLKLRGLSPDVRWLPEDENTIVVCVPNSRTTIRCFNLGITRPAPDVVARATEIDAAKATEMSVRERENQFINKVNATVKTAKKRKAAKSTNIVPFVAPISAPDDDLPVYEFQ